MKIESFNKFKHKIIVKGRKTVNEETCGICKFLLETMGQYFCRRYPPTVMMGVTKDLLNPNQIKQVINSLYPPTNLTHWCGEFKQKEIYQ